MRRLFLIFLLSMQAHATIYLTVSGASVRRAKIAVGRIHSLTAEGSQDSSLAKAIRDQLLTDLEFANIFEFVSESLYAKQDQASDLSTFNYEEWSNFAAAFALRIGYKISGGKVLLEVHLYDIPGRKQIFGTRYQHQATQYQRLVHTVTEDILKELTGEKGLFMSRILMVCHDLKKRKSPPKEVFVVDADGRNLTQLTFDNTLSFSPSWVNDGKHITYSQYDWVRSGSLRKRGIVIKKHNLVTGNRSILTSKDGMNSGISWNNKGTRAAVTFSYNSRPEIYFIGPEGGDPEPLSRNIQWKRITGEGFQTSAQDRLFDVEPSWSPDASKIVFSSARTGHPMIYVVDLATKIANQLTFAGTYNASPAWSPKGDKIVFAAQRLVVGNFDLYMLDPDGGNLQRLTVGDDAGRRQINSENPAWAPTGRHFAFANNETGNYAVYVMTTDSTFRRRISPEGKECKSPAWSQPEN
jgi:TolB protein